MGDRARRATCCWCSAGIFACLGDMCSFLRRDLTYSVEGGDLAEPGDTQLEAVERGEVAAEADFLRATEGEGGLVALTRKA